MTTGVGHERTALPERVTMGLLPYINAHALDEDYAQAAARRASTGNARGRPRVGGMGALALAVFAVLAVTAALQTSRDSVSDEHDRQQLIAQVQERTAVLNADRARETALARTNRALETALLRGDHDSGGLLSRISLLTVGAGTGAVHGPGIEAVADDAPGAQTDRNKVLDRDLQGLVNGLWQAGAEAISINGQRLTVLSAIRHAGEAITVNYRSLSRPYTILAIGDPNTLPGRFAQSTSGQAWLDLQRGVGLRFSMRIVNDLSLPAAPLPVLRYATQSGNQSGKETQ
jgi:uncharacterized protein YlxW (UPF0749 family)